MSRWIAGFSMLWLLGSVEARGQNQIPHPRPPNIAGATDEARLLMDSFRIPDGMRVELFAAEPDVANPVALYVDHDGRVYVCESFRQEAGVEDNRSHAEWLRDDLRAQTVDDRIAYIRKHLGDAATQYTQQDDRIRVLQDVDGDGRADQSTVFADRFNGIEYGTGAGVLPYQGNVYFTCIPHLFMLQDGDGDDIAEHRTVLHSGFGVRFAFRGHDMHGLIIGPDRRLYFSIGDRGYSVSPVVQDPRSGAVFRCELDGSQLTVIATGMRNPQELAFDRFGNLFTGDNNSDSGDRARWVYVVPGGDSGWRMEYQYLPDRGPFNREKIWHPFHPETPAYVVPPVDNLADGPSGLAFYPGTGLRPEFEDCFFLCDFRGQSSNSGIRTLSVKPSGAFWEIARNDETFWQMLPTDIAFSSDGKVYFSDWVHGWVGEGKGRIYAISDPEHAENAGSVPQLLNQGMADRSDDDLIELIEHPDQRVRQAAHFELSDRGTATGRLMQVLASKRPVPQRTHALWALEIAARLHGRTGWFSPEFISSLMLDREAEIRAQVARACGEMYANRDIDQWLIELLGDSHPRVRYFAAMSLGQRTSLDAADGIFQLLAENEDRDPMLRHAGIMALTWMDDAQVLERAAAHPSASVRLASVVAMRRLGSDGLAGMLSDADERIVIEAARAIYDVDQNRHLLDALSRLSDRAAISPHLADRVIAANFACGTPEHAGRVARIAADQQVDLNSRTRAIGLLQQWAEPDELDPLLGYWRPLPSRDESIAQNAMREHLVALLASGPEVSERVLSAAAKLKITEVQPMLLATIANASAPDTMRVDALNGLERLKYPEIGAVVEKGLVDSSPAIRAASLRLLSRYDVQRANPLLAQAVSSQWQVERQSALITLGQMTDAKSGEILLSLLNEMETLPPDCQLDLLMAIESRPEKSLADAGKEYIRRISENGPHAHYDLTLVGGDAERGKSIFFNRSSVSCLRCHQINGRGGEVGPDLSEIAKTRDRRYLLNSLIRPNLDIAEEFQTLIVLDIDGKTHTGIRKNEDEHQIVLMTANGNTLTILQEEIDDVRRGQSSMPQDLIQSLTLSDLRDLVEFLASQK